MCCDAITSQLLITHYFVVEFSSIVMLWLQNWWLPTILWDCDRTHMHCDAVTSKMMIDHYFVDRFFVLPLFRGSNSTNAVWRASCNARNFVALFRGPSSLYFVIELICIVMRSLQKMMIDHYFVDRFSCFALFRGPNSTNAMRRAHEI